MTKTVYLLVETAMIGEPVCVCVEKERLLGINRNGDRKSSKMINGTLAHWHTSFEMPGQIMGGNASLKVQPSFVIGSSL